MQNCPIHLLNATYHCSRVMATGRLQQKQIAISTIFKSLIYLLYCKQQTVGLLTIDIKCERNCPSLH